ncbi:hypothetical protein EX30DRAFT_349145 [Ascodesmis nigricans]|uniref:CsbD-like domain-containing protein n=1 Tax=Ascodesmis nigricans TaxID=341454 RepID=A0A4S2MWF4_9PEZI|nr:hypothetical protein EX30DRAFT_349145 [Ascodesmis nigricans]
MPLFSSRRRAVAAPVPARPRKAGLFSRTRRTRATGPMATSTRTSRRSARSGGTALTRRPTMGDKIHGMAKSIMGTLTNDRRKKREGRALQAGSHATAGTTTTTRRHRRRRW